MGRYRKIDPRIWNDAKFRGLTDRGKLSFLFVLTHPHLTLLGAMRASTHGLAHELGWAEKAFREAFEEALAEGMLECDEEAAFVSVPNFLRYNPPQSPNVVKSWESALDLVPECPGKDLLVSRVKAFAEGMTKGFAEALPEAFRKPIGNQKQKQEQKPKLEETTDAPDTSGAAVKRIWDFWVRLFGMQDSRQTLTTKRRGKIRKRLVEFTPEEIADALRGYKGDYWWSADPSRYRVEKLCQDREMIEQGLMYHKNPRDNGKGVPNKAQERQDQNLDAIRRAREADDASEDSLRSVHGSDDGGFWGDPDRREDPPLLESPQG